MEDVVKQVIVIRKDLKMRRGKEIAQGAHASIAFITRRIRSGPMWYDGAEIDGGLSEAEDKWLKSSFTKICLVVDSEQELRDLCDKASDAGLECNLITDAGKTEFDGVPTVTCLAIGPDYSSKIDPFTKHLKLY